MIEMKKSLLGIICFFACLFSTQAQALYGTTFRGGDDGGGTINKLIPATNHLLIPKSFESLAKNPNLTNFIQATDGKLYGMTTFGGSSNDGGGGAIFSYDPFSSTYTKLINFGNTNGFWPQGSLMQASDGKLYGLSLIHI